MAEAAQWLAQAAAYVLLAAAVALAVLSALGVLQRPSMGRWLCALGRHAPIRVITDMRLDEASPFGVRGTILASERRCRRCSKPLDGGRRA